MGNVCLTLLILAMSVSKYLAVTTGTEAPPGVYYIEELDEHRQAYSKVSFLSAGKRKELPPFEQMCYDAHTNCVAVLRSAELVCAQHKKYGLINFPSICELRYQNCLIKAREGKKDDSSVSGPFYYNGKLKDCQYYVEKTATIKDAVRRYFMEDLDYNIKLYETYKKNKK